ncbi:MAG: 4-hydroxy-tetrahydrodipicolinate reductase [Opitutae bacterium]|nr:4-hydroxy-tetrahydrodipicolinate reductase [Opitutae bacterium]
MSLSVLLNGANGRMGKAIQSIAEEHACKIKYPIDVGDNPNEGIKNCDVVIDFSLRDGTLQIAELAQSFEKPIVIGTTGHTKDERKLIEEISNNVPMVWAGNFSTGVNLLFFLTQQVAKVLGPESDFDPEIVEMHHRFKKDAPSGTADRLLEIILQSRNSSEQEISHGRQGIPGERKPNEVGSHALRGGDIVGEHTVLFAGMGERIELTHRATDRIIFAIGALKAANWVVSKQPGLYSMQDVLGLTA